MKRNFKVIKHDKNLSNLSDADIEKLYSTYIEMDGKHQNFKGSKREYCSTVASMIKDWMKAVVDKNGGISDKSLTGGKGTRKGILEKGKPFEESIKKASEKITDLKGQISAADTFITTTYGKKRVRITKANNPKIKVLEDKKKDLEAKKEELKSKIDEPKKVILTNDELLKGVRPFPGILTPTGKDVFETMKQSALNSLVSPKEIREIFNNANSEKPLVWHKPYIGKTLAELTKILETQSQKRFNELNDVYYDPTLFTSRTPESKSKSKSKPVPKVDITTELSTIEKELSTVETNLEDAKELKATAMAKLETEKTKTEADKAEYLKRITELEKYKTTKEAEIKSVEEEEERYLRKKARDFGKTIQNIAFARRPAVGETETFVKKVDVNRVATGEKYTLQELVNEADDYKRVIKFFLGGKLYTNYDVGIQGSEEVKTVKRFLKALPYKKLLEISPEGYAERVKFVDALIAEGDYFQMYGRDVRWSPEIEESFRSESFIFWTLLAKDIKDKDVVVNNFELLGKIFSHALFFAPVDFKTKYFTGDSKGVKSTSGQTNGFKFARDPVVGLAKILNVLSESASIDSSGNLKFNNPSIIFTFYRSGGEENSMLKYSQDRTRFTGSLPYELILEYNLKKLLDGSRGDEIKQMILKHKRDGYDLIDGDGDRGDKSNLYLLKEIIKETYKVPHETDFFPVKENGVPKPFEFSLPMGNNEKIRTDLKVAGYSKKLFGDDEPTVLNYTKLYKSTAAAKVPVVKNYTGSTIEEFAFPGLFEEGTVVTEVDVEGDPVYDDEDSKEPEGDDLRESKEDEVPATPIVQKTFKEQLAELQAKTIEDVKAKKAAKVVETTPIVASTLVKKPITQLSDEAKALRAQAQAEKAAIKAANKAAKKAKEPKAASKDEEESEEGEGKPSKGSGKPKAYIKKIIKYYC